jgi:hypothetical protein
MNSSKLRPLFFFLLIPLFCFCWHYLSGGFQIQKIRFHLPISEKWQTHYTETQKDDIAKIISQPFHYLAKGRQSYVFVSSDDKYVIKFFRYHLIRPKFIYHFLRIFPSLDNFRRYRIKAKKRQFEKWMDSYFIAAKELKEETGLVCVHLTETNDLPRNIVIIDRLGRKHTIDPNKTGFLIQKKTDLFLDKVKKLTDKKKDKELSQLISAYLDTVISRQFKGINNKDPSWLRNMGSIGVNEVVEIDVGRYTYAQPVNSKKELRAYLHRYIYSLRDYFSSHYPEMVAKFETIIDEKVDRCDF